MKTDLLESTSAHLNRFWNGFNRYLQGLAEPRRAARLRLGVIVLAVAWVAVTSARMVWMLLPQPESAVGSIHSANPLIAGTVISQKARVDIDSLVSWHLFGDPSQAATATPVPVQRRTSDSVSVDGVEKNAVATRLALKLQGVVSSSESELALAIIEYKNIQKQYSAGDKLPVSGRVSVAKILQDRVILNNAGKYESLKLFDKNSASARPLAAAAPTQKTVVDGREKNDIAQLAESYRQRLYQNPQSLADVVKISAVRSEGQLQGYRVGPGADKSQFEQLGFQAGDVVTAVNGIQLTDAGKAVELYQVMRHATDASFEVQRGGELVSISVSFNTVVAQ